MLPVVEPGIGHDEVPDSAAEPVDLVSGAGVPGAEVVDLDEEPSALFETDVAAHQTIVEAASSEVVDSSATDQITEHSGADDSDALASEETDDHVEPDADDSPPEPSLGFVERFTAAIGEVPISSRQ